MKKLEASVKDSSANNKSLVSQLQQEISRLKTSTKEFREKLESAQEESRFKDDFIKQVEDDKERIKREYSNKLANLEQALRAEKNKEKDLKSQLKQAEDQVMTLQSSDDHPDKKSAPQKYHNLGHMENELEDLKAENQKLKKDYEFFHSNYNTVCEKSKSYKEIMAESKREVEDLQKMLDVVNNEREMLEQQVEQLKLKLDCQQHNKIGEQEVKEELEQTIKQLQQQLHQTSGELHEKSVQLQQSNQLVEELRLELQSAHKKDTTDLPDVQQLYQEMVRLQDELESARSEAKSAGEMVAVLAEENSALSVCKEELSNDNEILRNQVTSLEMDFSELNKKFAALTNVHDELVESFEKVSSEGEECPLETPRKPLTVVEELHGKLKSVDKENKVLKHENLSVSSSRDLLQLQLKGAKQMIDKLKKELGHIESTSSDIESDMLASNATLKSTQKELKFHKDVLCKKQVELDTLTTESTSLQYKVKDAETQLEQLLKKNEDLEKDNFELTYSLSESQQQLNAAQCVSNELSVKLEKLEKKYVAMKEELSEKENLVKELILSNDLMESENTSLLSQINSLAQTIRQKTNCLFTAQDKLNAQKVTTTEAEKMIAMLDQTLMDSQQAKESSESQVKQLQASLTSAKETLALSKADNFQLRDELKDEQAKVKIMEEHKNSLQQQLNKAIQDTDLLIKQKAELEIEMNCAMQAQEKEVRSLQKKLQDKDWEGQRLLQEKATIRHNYEELQKKCSVMEGRCTNLQDGYSVLKQESLATGEEARTIQQHVQTLQQRYDQLQSENYHLKEEITTANEEKKRCNELEVKLTQQNAKVKQLMKNNEHLTKKYRCLQEDFENIQTGMYDSKPVSCTVSQQTVEEDAKQSTSSDHNKVLFAVQNTMTVSYK